MKNYHEVVFILTVHTVQIPKLILYATIKSAQIVCNQNNYYPDFVVSVLPIRVSSYDYRASMRSISCLIFVNVELIAIILTFPGVTQEVLEC